MEQKYSATKWDVEINGEISGSMGQINLKKLLFSIDQ